MAPHNLPNIEHREVTAIDEETGKEVICKELHFIGSDESLETLDPMMQAGIRLARDAARDALIDNHYFIESNDIYTGPLTLDEHSIPVIERQRQGEHSPNYAMPENDF